MNLKNYALIALLGAILFIPFLGHVHLFDWDEINFAESAREMLVTNNYRQVQVNFQPFWEKPPLFIWLQAASMNIFGVNEFAARLPNAIIGIFTLFIIFYIGRKQADDRLGWLWILCYVGSFLPHFYFKSGIIDPLFNLFIFLSIFQLSRLTAMRNNTEFKNLKISALSGLFCGLAILTKGPVALLVILVCMLFYWISLRFHPFLKLKYLITFFVIGGLVSSIWFAAETLRNGPWFIVTFIQYQVRLLTTADAGHGGPFYYHFLVLLFGCFPASIFLLKAFERDASEKYEIRNFKKWMTILLLVVLFIFSIVKTKIVHYSSLSYFPLTFLAAYYLYKLLYLPQKRLSFIQQVFLLLIAVLFSLAIIALPIAAMHTETLAPYINDAFARANLQANVKWSYAETAVGIFYLIASVYAIILLRKPASKVKGALILFSSSAIFLQLVLFFFLPKIERYSQGAAIDFYQAKKKEDCYIEVLGFKSYAYLFYTNKMPPVDSAFLKKNELIFGKLSKLKKPVYFVTTINHQEEYIRDLCLTKVGEKNGFVFLRRFYDPPY
jgi:4-amino-4-deoxy-L-arabinose transferase-like glycosyltransferase